MPRTKVRLGAGDAVKEVEVDVHEKDAPPWGIDARLSVVGTPVARVDGLAKASGTAKYTADVARPNLAYARIVRSPHAHAVVRSVGLDAVKAMPGVLAVRRFGPERVTFAGAPVAAVCAETETALDDAVAAMRVDYAVLPHVVDATAARDPAAPRVDPNRENLVPAGTRGRAPSRQGDPGAALAAAEVKVSAEYRTSVQTHVALEPHGSVAEFDAEGNLTLWCSTQAVAGVRAQAAQFARLDASKVRVRTEFMGGGFGCKFGMDACDRAAVEFARETGRPVKCMNDRREEHLTGGNRPDSVQRLTIGGTRDGTITALVGETYGTAGNGAGGADAANTVLYGIPSVAVDRATVSTFAGEARAFRAPGHPQGVFALEGMVDEFAYAIGMDPLALRRKIDRHPIRSLEWPMLAERSGWAKAWGKAPGSDRGPVKRGVGCAGGVWYAKGGGDFQVDVTLARDGSVVATNATQDIGTGTKTVIAMLVAEELGIDPQRVAVRIGDTRYPAGPNSGGSTTASSIGPAVREAGLRAKEALVAAVAKEWGVEEKEVRLAGGQVSGPGGKAVPFEQACAALPAEGARVTGQRRPNYAAFSDTCGGVQMAQVAVDVETGVVRVERVVAVHDAGRIVDPLTARSQVNGGVIQGISFALFEERRLDAGTGDMVNPTYDTYRIAGMADCPEIDVAFLDVANGANNVGMMGLGEPATVPTAAAVGNAVFHATGARVRTLPMTPPRVLAALSEARSTR